MSRRADELAFLPAFPNFEGHAGIFDADGFVGLSMDFTSSVAEGVWRAEQGLLENQADDANHEDGDDDVFDLEVVPLVPDPEADARRRR